MGRWVIEDVPRFCATVSDLLDGRPSAMELRSKILARRADPAIHRRKGRASFVVARDVDDPRVVSRLEEGRIEGLVVRVGDRRDYPNGPWAGLAVGRAAAGDPSSPLKGLVGIEAGLDAALSGVDAPTRRVRIDAARHPFLDGRPAEEDAVGEPVRTTIDLVVQGYCEQALDRLVADWSPKGAVAIVMEPATGDVLACAVRPSYDPSRSRAIPGYDHAFYGRVEPGSTFKPFTVARALAAGAIAPETRFEMPHARTFSVGRGTRTIHDAHDAGDVGTEGGTVVDLLAQSSNTGTAWLCSRLGDEGMVALLEDLGVERTFDVVGIAKGRERGGYYPRTGSRPPRGATDHLGFGFGHGFTLTPLRLASCFTAFAREDFSMVEPRFVLSVGDVDVPARPPSPSLCPDPRHRDAVRRGLVACVTDGTAARTVASPKFAIAGKTGTAKKPGTEREYYSSSFAGYAPADAPRIVVLVMAIEPTVRAHDGARPYGAVVAGPAVRSIVERTLGEYMGLPAADAPQGVAGGGAPASEGPSR
jgi:cell division protein FtsI (penicillin-binding protein 3)